MSANEHPLNGSLSFIHSKSQQLVLICMDEDRLQIYILFHI